MEGIAPPTATSEVAARDVGGRSGHALGRFPSLLTTRGGGTGGAKWALVRRSSTLGITLLGASAIFLVACGSGNDNQSSASANGGSGAGTSTSSHAGGAGGDGSGGGTEAGGGGGSAGGASGVAIGGWIGMNGFVNDPTDLLSAGGVVREYHTWDWNQHYWDQNGEHHTGVDAMVFQGMVSTWNLDDVYKRWNDAHVDVFPSIQGTIPAVSGTTDFPKPMPQGADPTDPASYTDHGKMMFQFAARYGSTHVDASKLTLAAGQPVLSGAGYLRYLENGNEPDNIWAYNLGGSAMPQLADEFAAMSSADYDGDQGRLGAGVGAKTADATMKVVMAGLAGTAPGQDDWLTNVKAYLQGIKDWSVAHRAGSVPVDVVNMHYYCLSNDAGRASAPEDCKLEETIKSARTFSNQTMPGKPFWLTEFGYDRVSGSPNAVTPVASFDAETVQAQWLLRGAVAILLAGVDRFTMYMSRDAGPSGLFATSGLANVDLTSQVLGTVSQRYAALDYFATFASRLGAMHLDGEVDSGDASVRVVRFIDAKGNQGFFVWCPTATGTTVADFKLAVGKASAARKVDLAKGSPNGNESALSVSSGKVSLTVSENPTIVLAP